LFRLLKSAFIAP
ncbi:hypothetical protein Zm00014a_025821, partial [Zea mays]